MVSKRPAVGRERIAVTTRTRAERDELRAAAERDGTSLSEYLLDAGLRQARGGGLMIPRETADLIRDQARARGVAVGELAALIAAAAVGWPRAGN